MSPRPDQLVTKKSCYDPPRHLGRLISVVMRQAQNTPLLHTKTRRRLIPQTEFHGCAHPGSPQYHDANIHCVVSCVYYDTHSAGSTAVVQVPPRAILCLVVVLFSFSEGGLDAWPPSQFYQDYNGRQLMGKAAEALRMYLPTLTTRLNILPPTCLYLNGTTNSLLKDTASPPANNTKITLFDSYQGRQRKASGCTYPLRSLRLAILSPTNIYLYRTTN